MRYERSSALFKAAQSVIPGGGISPVRAFQAVGGTPIFVDHVAKLISMMKTEID